MKIPIIIIAEEKEIPEIWEEKPIENTDDWLPKEDLEEAIKKPEELEEPSEEVTSVFEEELNKRFEAAYEVVYGQDWQGLPFSELDSATRNSLYNSLVVYLSEALNTVENDIIVDFLDIYGHSNSKDNMEFWEESKSLRELAEETVKESYTREDLEGAIRNVVNDRYNLTELYGLTNEEITEFYKWLFSNFSLYDIARFGVFREDKITFDHLLKEFSNTNSDLAMKVFDHSFEYIWSYANDYLASDQKDEFRTWFINRGYNASKPFNRDTITPIVTGFNSNKLPKWDATDFYDKQVILQDLPQVVVSKNTFTYEGYNIKASGKVSTHQTLSTFLGREVENMPDLNQVSISGIGTKDINLYFQSDKGNVKKSLINRFLYTVENLPTALLDYLPGSIIALDIKCPYSEDVCATYSPSEGIYFWQSYFDGSMQPEFLWHELGHGYSYVNFGTTGPEYSNTDSAKEFIAALHEDSVDISSYGNLSHPEEAFAEAFQSWCKYGTVVNEYGVVVSNVNTWFEKYIAKPNKLYFDYPTSKMIKRAQKEDWYEDYQLNPENYIVYNWTSPDGKEGRQTITRKSDGMLLLENFLVFDKPKNKSIPINYNTSKTP